MTTLPIGGTFAGYVIDGVIARGGMGVVYRATQLQPHRQIALKLIAPEHATDAGYRERFLREADLLASVEHCPSIVPIYASGEFDGQLYLAMRYMDGPDLGKLLETEGPLSLARTVDILVPVAAALDAAHESGLVHRDVKPANILFDSRGRVYLTDFGLTKKAASDSGLTRPGQAVGTVGYMAPEQFTGRADPNLAPRIDVYALACVLHACLTGTEPYPRDSYEQALFAHVYEPPPKVTGVRPDLPPEVDEILARALAKEPAERFASAGELVAALGAVVAKAGPFPPVPDTTSDAGKATVIIAAGEAIPPPPTEKKRLEDGSTGGTPSETGKTEVATPTESGPPTDPDAGSGGTTGRAGQETVVVVAGGGAGGGGGSGGSTGGIPPENRSMVWIAVAGGAVLLALAAIVFGSGFLNGPRPSASPIGGVASASPSATVRPTPTVAPTASPTATATPIPSRTPFPGGRFGTAEDTERLLALVPDDIRSTCEGTEMYTSFPIAKVQCNLPSGPLWYELHPSLTALRDDFDVVVSVAEVEPESGDCEAGTPGESAWNFQDDPETRTRGRYVCDNQTDGYSSMDVTYEDVLVALELFDDVDIKTVYSQWQDGSLNPIIP